MVLLIVVTLVGGLLVGTVLPGRGAIAKAVGKDSATPLAVPDPMHLSGAFASIVQAVEPAIVTQSSGYQGVGFALPSNTAIKIYDDLIEHGKVTRGSIGVSFQEEQKHESEGAEGSRRAVRCRD